jgi:hypothetical protein
MPSLGWPGLVHDGHLFHQGYSYCEYPLFGDTAEGTALTSERLEAASVRWLRVRSGWSGSGAPLEGVEGVEGAVYFSPSTYQLKPRTVSRFSEFRAIEGMPGAGRGR